MGEFSACGVKHFESSIRLEKHYIYIYAVHLTPQLASQIPCTAAAFNPKSPLNTAGSAVVPLPYESQTTFKLGLVHLMRVNIYNRFAFCLKSISN